jgi:hypothetical protein
MDNLEWSQTFEISSANRTTILVDSEDRIFLMSNDFLEGLAPVRTEVWVHYMLVSRLSSQGTPIWTRPLPDNLEAADASICKAELDKDGLGLQIQIYTRGTINWGNNVITKGENQGSYFTLTYSPEGEVRQAVPSSK